MIVKDNPVPSALNFNTQFYDAGGSLLALQVMCQRRSMSCSNAQFSTVHADKFRDKYQNYDFPCIPSATLTLADSFGVGGERTTNNCADEVLSYHVDQLNTYPPHAVQAGAISSTVGNAKAHVLTPATNVTPPTTGSTILNPTPPGSTLSNCTATRATGSTALHRHTISLPITDDD